MPKPRDFTLPTEIVLIKDLKPHPRNYRKHPKEQLNHIVESIKENKIYRNIVIAKDNTILAGHGVIEGLQILEATEAPCIRLDIEPDSPEALKVLAGDNEIANLANDNTFLLAELLKEVSDKTDNLIGTGYTDSTLEDLLDSLTKSSEGTEYQEPEYQGDNGYSDGDGGAYGDGDDTEPREVKEAVEDEFEVPEENEIKTDIVLGDLFEIGNHRLLCGDSTDKDSVSRLMNGEKADMVFTDPPYGMKLNADYSGAKGGVDFSKEKNTNGGNKYNNIIGDHDDFTPQLINTIFACFNDCKEIFIWGADYFAELLPNKNDGSWVVWDKRANGNNDLVADESSDKIYGSCFELCWSKAKHKRDIARVKWAGIFGTEKEFDHKRHHPTQKPSLLPRWFFTKWGKENDLVADLYLGSGSTMVASHQLDRRCYGMELDPRYCQVIIERMIKLDPTLVIKKNGEPFALDIQ